MGDVSGEKVPVSLRKYLRVSELKGPVSITFACTFGLIISLIDQDYYPKSIVELEAKDVVSAILLVMDLGTAEKFYVSTVFKMAGMVGGVALGIGLSMGEELIWTSYKDQRRDWHAEDWKLILYKSCVFAPVLLLCTLMMKRFPKYAYPIVVFAVQVPTGLFARGIQHAVSKIASAIAAVCVAVLAVVVFERINTTALLTETNGQAIGGVLRICELAIDSDHSRSAEFGEHAENVHKTVSQAEASITTYFQWRALTFREQSKKDFSLLVKPLRPLFYEGYSLYWANTQSYKAAEYRADILFCNSETSYETHFKPHRDLLVRAFGNIRLSLGTFLSRQYFTDELTEGLLNELIEEQLWNNVVFAQKGMRSSYMEHRTECFSTFAQRWNVTHFMRQTATIAIALVAYIRAIATLFLKDIDTRSFIEAKLDRLTETLDELRSSEMGGLRNRADSAFTDSTWSLSSPTGSVFASMYPSIQEAPPDRSEEVLRTFARSQTKGGL
jgi:hypothetical protein